MDRNMGKRDERNLMDMRPCRTRKWKTGERVTIVVPRIRTLLGKHFCDALGMNKTYTINLDEYGSAVWRLCNGKRTVREIGEELRERFGEEVEPLYERLATFFRMLRSEELVRFEG